MAESVGEVGDLAAVWRRVFAEHAAAGGTAAAICARHGVRAASWSYWRKKLGVVPQGGKRPASGEPRRKRTKVVQGFAELVVRSEGQPDTRGIEIALSGGTVVRVGTGAGERELAMVLKALGAC